MRALCLAAVLALAGWRAQPDSPAGRLVIVVDADAPSRDAQQAAGVRGALLERLDPSLEATYVELTAERLAPVQASEAASFRNTVFTVTAPTYSGVLVTYTQSVEILRGNEALRDDVIARACAPQVPACGGLVRAAVEAEARRVEETSARKLRNLVAGAAGWRGAKVVLITSGWPVRDEGRAGLPRAMDLLRRRGVSLMVVRQPPSEPYRGLVRDAAESLAAQLPAPFAAMADEADVERVATLLAPPGSAAPAPAEPPAPDPELVPTDAPATDPSATATGSRSDTPPRPGKRQPLDSTLQKAIDYVARFERTFTSILWHERYEQEDRVWRRFGASGATTSAVAGRRTLESEMFFAWLPQDRTWITVRDVTSVDGRAVPAEERRLPVLAARATVSLLELRDLARENGRYNIGQIVRTFNEPTLALLFLDDRYRDRVRLSRRDTRTVDGRRLALYAFQEEARPTLIQSNRRDVPAQGTFEIDEATGEIWQTTIEMSEPAARISGSMSVDYRPHVAFDVMVPREMREVYASPSREQVTATATYSDFRRFETAGRIVPP